MATDDTDVLERRLPDGWELWAHEPAGPVVLAYRPDVFDGSAHPAACLPTISVASGTRRPGTGDSWRVTLYFEPDVDCGTERYETRAAAIDAAVELAERFVAGKFDPREVYQVPRESYFAALDRLLET